MHVGGEQATEMAGKATEDDMAEGDLGNGLGKKPGGLYEKSRSHSRGRGELLDLMSPVELLKRSNEPFSWTSCSTLYAEFRQELEAERPCPRWRYRGTSSPGDASNEELRKRLQEVTEEAQLLRCELEATQRHLDGKHEALKILQSQAVFEKATSHTKTLLQKSEERTKLLEKEVNTLQWEITFNQVQFKSFQQSWKEMYDSVCIEKKALGDTVVETVKEMQELRSENSSLSQQCLELMALLSIREQRAIQGSQPLGSSLGEDGTVLELAVLGACHCHTAGGDPCPCARTAASSRKQVLHLKQQLEVQRRCKEEAYVMADAFRIAFEQQLKRKSDQVLRLAKTEGSLRKDQPRAHRGEASQKWRFVTVAQRLKGMLQSTAEGKISDDLAETLHHLVDLLNDKEEALAHQRKVSYMLARNTEELECRLQQLRAQDCAVTGRAQTQDAPEMPDAQAQSPGEDADPQAQSPGEDADAQAQSPGAGGSPAGTRATEGGSESL